MEHHRSASPRALVPQEPSQERCKATLAKNADQLKSKKHDSELSDISVNPLILLFQKTCEGGTQGLLMNHLSLGVGREGALRIILDPSDSMPMGKVGEDKDLLEPEDDVDLTTLHSETFSFFL
jgi:condensin complex subunit 2